MDCGVGAYCNDFGQCERGGAGTPCLTNAQCPVGDECFGAENGQEGVCGCKAEEFETEAKPADVLIVMDRSTSFSGAWSDARNAINAATSTHDANANFGIMFFPSSGDCTVGNPVVPIAAMNASSVATAINNTSAAGGLTPIKNSFDRIWSNDPFANTAPGAQKAIVFVTDGGETCSGAATDTINHVTNLYSQRGVLTFAIGYGGGASTSLLMDMAMNGGTMMPHNAPNGTQFAMVLDGILGSLLPCTYTLNQNPSGEITVLANGSEVPSSGWTYDPQTMELTFDQQTCDSLRSASIDDVKIISACTVVPD